MAKKKNAKKKTVAKPVVLKAEVSVDETPVTPTVAIIKSAPPVKDNWRTSVVEEAKELKDRMVKLRNALDQNKVPADQKVLLTKQHAVMTELYIILNTRLSN